MPGKPLTGTVAIVGVGLIGGSLGLALKKAEACSEVIGADSRDTDIAVKHGAIDRGLPLKAAVARADVVVLTVPVGAMEAIAGQIAPHLKKGAIVTDAGSVKGPVVKALTDRFGSRFVGGHPIAGSERSGVEAADETLFTGARCILTPTDDTDDTAVKTVAALWRAAGASVTVMSPEVHDKVFACVSHLPHLVAFALMEAVAAAADNELAPAEFAAGGLKDFTRIAASNPVMWRDIFLANRTALLSALDGYEAELTTLRVAIEDGDGDALLAAFARAGAVRKQVAG